MTGCERMMLALERKEPDRVPVWELIINQPVISSLYGDISYADFVEREDLDGGLSYPLDGPIKSQKDLDKYSPPDPDALRRLKTLEDYVKRFKGEKAVVFLGHEAFEFSHYLMGGMDKLFISYVLNPDLAKNLAEMISKYKCRVLKNAVEVGADILLTGDDYAGRKGPFVSPEHFKEFILPYLKKAVNVAKENNVPFIKHTDGNLWSIMDMLIEAEIDALDPIEPIAGMDIGEVKKKYKDKICVVGNVDCSQLLPFGRKEEVEEAVKETIAKASVGGGHILASSNSIHPAVNPDNYRTMLNTARRWGTYPLDQKMVEEYRGKNYIAKFQREIVLEEK